MNWIKASLIALTFSTTTTMAALNSASDQTGGLLPSAKLMMECDPTYVSFTKELYAFTIIGMIAASSPGLQADFDRITNDIENMKTCEDFQRVYKDTMRILTSTGFDLEAYLASEKGSKEFNDLLETIRRLAANKVAH